MDLESPHFQPKPHEFSLIAAGMGAIMMLTILFFVEILHVPRRRIDSDRQ